MDVELRNRLDRIEARLVEIQSHNAGQAEWRRHVDNTLVDHSTALEKLKAWQFKLIGAYLGAAVLCGVAFQIVISLLGV